MCQTRPSRAKLRGVDLALGDLVISCDVVLHPLLGDAFVICDRAGEPLTAMSALDLDHPHEIPVIAEPAKLPPGAGALLLNRIARARAPGPLRYAGPYPTPALYRALAAKLSSLGRRSDVHRRRPRPRDAARARPGARRLHARAASPGRASPRVQRAPRRQIERAVVDGHLVRRRRLRPRSSRRRRAVVRPDAATRRSRRSPPTARSRPARTRSRRSRASSSASRFRAALARRARRAVAGARALTARRRRRAT